MLLAGMKNWLARPPLPEAPLPEAALEQGAETRCARDAIWPAERIELAGRLWGEGYVLPGGEEEALRLTRPLGLSATSRLLVLGCGPGGAVRSIAGRLGAWVSGVDSDPNLVLAGTALCAASGLGERAQVSLWDPEQPDFQRRHYHHALGLEPMRAASAETVLAGISLGLRPHGQLVLLEVICAERAVGAPPEFARWMQLERRIAPPPSEAAIGRALGRLGFEIRVVEDVSQQHTKNVVRGWREIVRTLEEKRPEPADATRLVREGELWLHRGRLLGSGRLRLIRWHAFGRRGSNHPE